MDCEFFDMVQVVGGNGAEEVRGAGEGGELEGVD